MNTLKKKILIRREKTYVVDSIQYTHLQLFIYNNILSIVSGR